MWLVPLAFVATMMMGGILGYAGYPLPLVETGIGLSVVVMSLAIALGVKLRTVMAMALVGLFALFHGHAHGSEGAELAYFLPYATGFVIATALLHMAGIALGLGFDQLGKTPVCLFEAGRGVGRSARRTFPSERLAARLGRRLAQKPQETSSPSWLAKALCFQPSASLDSASAELSPLGGAFPGCLPRVRRESENPRLGFEDSITLASARWSSVTPAKCPVEIEGGKSHVCASDGSLWTHIQQESRHSVAEIRGPSVEGEERARNSRLGGCAGRLRRTCLRRPQIP